MLLRKELSATETVLRASTPPPKSAARLLLTMLLLRIVVEGESASNPPPSPVAVFPLKVVQSIVIVRSEDRTAAIAIVGMVIRDLAAGGDEGRRGGILDPPPANLAELPLTVLLVTVMTPRPPSRLIPPPSSPALLPSTWQRMSPRRIVNATAATGGLIARHGGVDEC